MIWVGLDVHCDYCEVAIADADEVRSGGQVPTTPAALEHRAGGLGAEAAIAIESTANALAIVGISAATSAGWCSPPQGRASRRPRWGKDRSH
jgi:hypothetical protein